MDGPRDYHTKCCKSDRERQYCVVSIIIEILKKMIQMNLLKKEKQTHRLRKQTYDNHSKEKEMQKGKAVV